MQCDEYRELIAATPSGLSAGAAEHAAQCSACDAYRRSMQSLDQLISRALNIDIPELAMPELADIDGLSNVVSLPLRRVAAPVWLGLAASIAVVSVLAVRFLANDAVYPSLSEEIVAHLDHEPGALRVTTEAISAERLESVIGERARMDSNAGLISYARSCVINGHTVPHLVIQGESGPVTVLLLPDEMIDAAVTLEGEGIRGVILPVGNGSIAIIGERDEPLEVIEKRVVDSVQWKT